MIKLFVDLWDKNKDKLENYFRNSNITSYGTNYIDLLKTVINEALNNNDLGIKFSDKVGKIEFGDYTGIMILTFSLDVEFPSTDDIMYTSIDYGSCTACDAIQAVWNEDDFETMIKSYMILSLHLIQHMKCYGNIYNSAYIDYKEDNVFNTIITEKKKRKKAGEIPVMEKGRRESKFVDDKNKIIEIDNLKIESTSNNSDNNSYSLIGDYEGKKVRIIIEED